MQSRRFANSLRCSTSMGMERAMSVAGSEGRTSLAGVYRPGLYRLFGKRALDIILSATGLLLLSPLLFSIAILIKLTSKGPVFYRQGRVGLNGAIFRILKFRSMHIGADSAGPALTCAGDRRITSVGRWLHPLSS